MSKLISVIKQSSPRTRVVSLFIAVFAVVALAAPLVMSEVSGSTAEAVKPRMRGVNVFGRLFGVSEVAPGKGILGSKWGFGKEGGKFSYSEGVSIAHGATSSPVWVTTKPNADASAPRLPKDLSEAYAQAVSDSQGGVRPGINEITPDNVQGFLNRESGRDFIDALPPNQRKIIEDYASGNVAPTKIQQAREAALERIPADYFDKGVKPNAGQLEPGTVQAYLDTPQGKAWIAQLEANNPTLAKTITGWAVTSTTTGMGFKSKVAAAGGGLMSVLGTGFMVWSIVQLQETYLTEINRTTQVNYPSGYLTSVRVTGSRSVEVAGKFDWGEFGPDSTKIDGPWKDQARDNPYSRTLPYDDQQARLIHLLAKDGFLKGNSHDLYYAFEINDESGKFPIGAQTEPKPFNLDMIKNNETVTGVIDSSKLNEELGLAPGKTYDVRLVLFGNNNGAFSSPTKCEAKDQFGKRVGSNAYHGCLFTTLKKPTGKLPYANGSIDALTTTATQMVVRLDDVHANGREGVNWTLTIRDRDDRNRPIVQTVKSPKDLDPNFAGPIDIRVKNLKPATNYEAYLKIEAKTRNEKGELVPDPGSEWVDPSEWDRGKNQYVPYWMHFKTDNGPYCTKNGQRGYKPCAPDWTNGKLSFNMAEMTSQNNYTRVWIQWKPAGAATWNVPGSGIKEYNYPYTVENPLTQFALGIVPGTQTETYPVDNIPPSEFDPTKRKYDVRVLAQRACYYKEDAKVMRSCQGTNMVGPGNDENGSDDPEMSGTFKSNSAEIGTGPAMMQAAQVTSLGSNHAQVESATAPNQPVSYNVDLRNDKTGQIEAQTQSNPEGAVGKAGAEFGSLQPETQYTATIKACPLGGTDPSLCGAQPVTFTTHAPGSSPAPIDTGGGIVPDLTALLGGGVPPAGPAAPEGIAPGLGLAGLIGMVPPPVAAAASAPAPQAKMAVSRAAQAAKNGEFLLEVNCQKTDSSACPIGYSVETAKPQAVAGGKKRKLKIASGQASVKGAMAVKAKLTSQGRRTLDANRGRLEVRVTVRTPGQKPTVYPVVIRLTNGAPKAAAASSNQGDRLKALGSLFSGK